MPLKPRRAACADRPQRELHQLDRATPLKVRACRGTCEGSSFEVFTLRHALCLSYSKVEVSDLSCTRKLERGPARDGHRARVARRVDGIITQRQNIVAGSK